MKTKPDIYDVWNSLIEKVKRLLKKSITLTLFRHFLARPQLTVTWVDLPRKIGIWQSALSPLFQRSTKANINTGYTFSQKERGHKQDFLVCPLWGNRGGSNPRPSESQSDALTNWATTTVFYRRAKIAKNYTPSKLHFKNYKTLMYRFTQMKSCLSFYGWNTDWQIILCIFTTKAFTL